MRPAHSDLVDTIQLIRSPNTSLETLEEVAKQHMDDPSVVIALLQNLRCPLMVFHALSGTSDAGIRYKLAYHPRCPSDVLRAVANHSSCKDPFPITTTVMEHPNTPTDVWAECRYGPYYCYKLFVRFLP